MKRAARRVRGASGEKPLADIGWIRALARPYLRGYPPVLARKGSLLGYWFLASPTSNPRIPNRTADSVAPAVPSEGMGFFVGYLASSTGFAFLTPVPPECVVFAWIDPQADRLHRRLVLEPDGLLPKTFEYIRWLTHRPPRFVFHKNEFAVMTRHQPMHEWPKVKWRHYSRNFFIETLAWLVRSGLVGRLSQQARSRG